MSSSDDDWMPKSKPPGLTSTSTENSMMAARRRALQQKREQQQQQQQAQTNVSLLSTASTTSAAPPPAVKVRGRLGAQEEPPARESSLPTDIFGDSSSRPSTTASVTVAPRPTATAAVTSSMPHQQSLNVPTAAAAAAASSAPIEDVVESLRLQVETKKELLAAASKKEEALLERARAQKAKKLAETKLLDNQLQLVKDKANALTRSMEHEVEQARQQEEKRVEAARRKVEEEVRATYEASLAEVQAQIATAREEEQRLSGIVEGSGAARDAVTSAVTAALGKIVSKLPEMFSANSDVSTEWMDRLHQQVRHEVRSSFAVSAESDAQDERESYKKYFEELLKFWKDAEVSERERIAAMDDKLLSELDRVAQEDVERLRRQEMSMEEIYVQSREEWAVQHQKLLEIELSAAMKRRHTELEEQRALRLQLHEARIRDIEERHKDQLDLEEQWHARQMNQVRESFAKEDELQERRHKTVLSTQEIITQSMDSLQTVLGSMEGVFGSLKDYQQSVDHKRSDLEKERAAAITDHEALLTSLHESITTQSVAVESEREKANATLMQMQVLSQQLEQHLHNESSWLEQQERVYEGNRSEWEREYRSWTQLVQREKAVAEERFSGALTSLQRYVTLLGAEERELTVETEAMKRAFAEVSTKAEEEIDSIHATETDLEKRRLAMSELVTAMDEKRSAVGQQWRAIQEKRKKLAMDREQLTEDEGKLQQMMYALKLVSAQMEFARMEAASTAEHTRAVRHDLARSKEALGAAQQYAMGRSPPDALRMGPQHGANTSPVALNNADRLPTRVLQELQAQLDSAPSGGGPAPIALRSDRPARSPQRVTPPRRTKQSQAAAHTSRGPARHGEDRSPRATGTQRRHHYDPAHEPFPSSQPVTEARSSYHSQSQGREWTPTGNTFTNLAGFSDMEYT